MNKPKIKTKFIESAFLGFGYTLLLVMGYLSLAFSYFTTGSMEDETIFTEIILIVMLGVLPTLLWVFLIHRGFSIIEINQKCIKKSLFKIFHKRIIYWNEVREIIVINRVSRWIFFGKIEMKNLAYDKLVKHKDIIHLSLTTDVLKTVRLFCNQEIIGLDSTDANL